MFAGLVLSGSFLPLFAGSSARLASGGSGIAFVFGAVGFVAVAALLAACDDCDALAAAGAAAVLFSFVLGTIFAFFWSSGFRGRSSARAAYCFFSLRSLALAMSFRLCPPLCGGRK